MNREDEVIQTLIRYFEPHPRLPLPAGADDAILIKQIPGRFLVLSVDAHMEGVHFVRGMMGFGDIGYRALAAALSDLAAMAARPLTFLVNLEIPLDLSLTDISDVYEGFRPLMKRFCISPSGGNITRSERIGLVITVVGETLWGQGLLRRAREGNLVAVSGDLGRSFGGLKILLNRNMEGQVGELAHDLIDKFLRPLPRLEELQKLFHEGVIPVGGMDISDGLGVDAGRMARENGVKIVLDASALPIHAATRAFAEVAGLEAWEVAVASGEEFEILLTIEPEHRNALERMGWTVIGEVQPAFEPGAFLRIDGKEIPIDHLGYDHLVNQMDDKGGETYHGLDG